MPELLFNLVVLNSVLCLVLAFHFYLSPAQHVLPARLLGVNYTIYALQNVLLALLLSQDIGAQVRGIVAMLIGPAFWLYACAVIFPPRTWLTPYLALHLVPALCVAILMWFASYQWLNAIILASFTLYLIAVLKIWRLEYWPNSQLGRFSQAARFCLQVQILIIALNLFSEIAISLELKNGKALRESYTLLLAIFIFLSVHIITLVAALQRWSYINWLQELRFFTQEQIAKVGTTKPPVLNQEELTALFCRWEQMVTEQQLHVVEYGINLNVASRKLGVPARHLSNAINQIYGASFSQYLNARRIDEAKILIRQFPEKALTELMLEAGFNSKSSFNKEFVRFEGTSPSEYRRNT